MIDEQVGRILQTLDARGYLDNALVVFWRDGRRDLGHGPKARVARDLLALVADHLEAKA